jgi:AcrR family transcriptional regulator
MRGLAQELGVVPMALYKHVANKDELLDGMVDIVFSEIELPSADLDWRSAMRRRASSTREALKRHSWAIGMMESRHPGPAGLRNHNAVMGCLREAGFSFKMAIHAYSVQDAYIYGFALQERDTGFETPDGAGEAAQRRAETIGAFEDYPYLVEIATKLPESGFDNAVEFAWGLDLILDGLDLLRHAGPAPA